MPIQTERHKWILYKHTSNYDQIKAVAMDVKNRCGSDVSAIELHRMQERLAAINLYKTRNPKDRPLDSVNHRINTLEYYMFGYEDDRKRFIFSPLGNLFLSHINDDEKLTNIFTTMLFAVQFEHYANGTPVEFQIYPFRFIFQLLMDSRLDYRLYDVEYALIIPFVKQANNKTYEETVKKILGIRAMDKESIIHELKSDEHTYVNCIYEWQYYTKKLFHSIGILATVEGTELCRLQHPRKTNSKSDPTSRRVKTGYSEIAVEHIPFVKNMLSVYRYDQKPLSLDDPERMKMDVVKEIYAFYPHELLVAINEESDPVQEKLLQLPMLIDQYSLNENNETAYLFEDVLTDGFNMFVNVEARKIGGPGHTDIECLYLTKKKKFAVDAKSTHSKLSALNAGRLSGHREEIGAQYTIVVTPRYVPAVKRDIKKTPIVIILASTFSEYLYNHIYHDVREIDYKDFDDIIINNLGTDISKQISNLTIDKFGTHDTGAVSYETSFHLAKVAESKSHSN